MLDPPHIQGGVVPKPPANFTRLDPGRSDVGMLIGAMLRAREIIALSVARLVESLPLSTPPGATSRILPGPIIAAGFARPPSALVKGLRLGLAAIGVGGVVLLLVMA
jgi:hypothetical protein